MAIIYSYPTVTPTVNDLVLGTDVDAAGKPTKNFTVQSIIDLVTVSGNNLQAVLDNGNTATGKDIDLTNNSFRGGSFITTGNATISGTTAGNFTLITSTNFAGDITGIVKAGSSIEGTVTGVTQAAGDNSTKLATTAYVDTKVDPSVLQYLGDATGPFDLNLVNDDFKIAGTANQIITTATTVAGNVGTITLAFPSGGITLPNGSIATTQLATDNSTKVATTAFVHSHSAAQDLAFIGDSGSGTVLLDSQQLDLEGTANQIVTQASGQKITFSLPGSVTISGTYTGTTFAGDLNGTINTATTGTTQAPGNNSTKIATTAYVDAAAGAKTLSYKDNNATVHTLNLTSDDLEFLGDSNITVTAAAVAANVGTITVDLNNSVNISGTMTAGTFTDGTFTGSSGTYTGYASITSTVFVGALTGNASTASALASAGNIALSGDVSSILGPYTYTSGGNLNISTEISDTTVTGKLLTNLPTPTSSAIAASDTILAAMAKLQGQISGIPAGLVYKGTWNANTNTPTLQSGVGTTGNFYIVSVAGSTNLDGITDWKVGDWAIFVEVGGTDTWQKIDQTNEVLGSGTTNAVTKWTGTNTIGTGLMTDDGTDVTIGNSGNLIVEGNTTLGNADSDTTLIKGPGTADKNFIIHEGLGVGTSPSYGNAGQVLTSGGSAAAANTWTTPTTGTVTSIATNNGLTGGTITTTGTIGIDTVGTNNAIEFLSTATPASSDLVWFSDVNDANTLRKCTVADLLTLDPARSLAATLAVGNTSGANDIIMADDQKVNFGTGSDLQIYHNGTTNNSNIDNNTGGLYITQNTDDGDIIFRSDDGSGGVVEYFKLDGSLVNGTTTLGATNFPDNSKIFMGTGSDLRLFHNGTDSIIQNATGDIYLENTADDKDIIFMSDNGSGGTAVYMRIDGSATNVKVEKPFVFKDNIKANFGDGNDLQIYHDTSNSYIDNTTGSLLIRNTLDDYHVIIQSDNGGGGVADYFRAKGDTGQAILYHYGNQKFTTETSGVGITGDADVSGQIFVGAQNSTFSENNLRFKSAGAAYIDHNTTGQNVIFRVSNSSSLDTQIMRLLSNGFVELSQYGSGKSGTPAYNLEVDSNGKVITTPSTNPGGKGGIFTGSASFTGTTAATLFSIRRNTTGQLIFDVFLTSDQAGGSTKKYVVAHKSNSTVIYNKIIETTGSPDFTVAFSNVTDQTTGDSVGCVITPTASQTVSYTIVVGFDNGNGVVVS